MKVKTKKRWPRTQMQIRTKSSTLGSCCAVLFAGHRLRKAGVVFSMVMLLTSTHFGQTGDALNIEVTLEQGQTFGEGWILASPRFSSNLTYPILVDEMGDVRFNEVRPLEGFNFDQHPDGSLSWFAAEFGWWNVLDSALQVQEVVKFFGGDADFHDLELREDGSQLLMGTDIITFDVSDSVPDPEVPERAIIDCLLQEQDDDGQLLWSWRASDHIPPTWCTHCNWSASLIDAYHHNSFQTMQDGNILLCLRNMDLVVLIDKQTGEPLWRFGGPFSDFTFLEPDGPFSQQHDIQWLSGNRLLLLDNASSSFEMVSRGVEYVLDFDNWTAQIAETWPHPDGSFASSQGSIQRLEDGGTLIGWGSASGGLLGGGTITEYGADGALRGTISFPPNHFSYRARKVSPGELPLHVGCMMEWACNYDPEAIVSAPCGAAGDGCDDGDDCTVDDVWTEDCGCEGQIPPDVIDSDQCNDPLAINFNPCSALPFDDGSCQYLVPFRVDPTVSGAVPSAMSLQVEGQEGELALEPAGFGTWRGEVILSSGAWTFRFLADGILEPIGRTLDLSFPVTWDGSEVRGCYGTPSAACPGCNDPDAIGYSPFAEGESLCGAGAIGCTQPQATNFDPSAHFDDGSCQFNSVSACPEDLTGDGVVGVSDVLTLLTFFGTYCN